MFFSDELKTKFRLTKFVKLTFSRFVLKQEMDSMLSEHVMALHAGKKRWAINQSLTVEQSMSVGDKSSFNLLLINCFPFCSVFGVATARRRFIEVQLFIARLTPYRFWIFLNGSSDIFLSLSLSRTILTCDVPWCVFLKRFSATFFWFPRASRSKHGQTRRSRNQKKAAEKSHQKTRLLVIGFNSL